MKKIAAAVTAVLCVMGCMAFAPAINNNSALDTSITASAASSTKVTVLPGVNAGKYSYEFADTQIYTHSASVVKPDVKSKDEAVKEAAVILGGADGSGYAAKTSGSGGVLEKFYKSDGYKLNLYCVTVKSPTEKDPVLKEYRVGLDGVKDTVMDLKVQDIKVPEEVKTYFAKAFPNDTLVDPDHVTLIADNAFGKGYLKSIDLTGIQYIGKSAFANAEFITEITIPSSVHFVGDAAFQNSGLKTLTVNNDMPAIPASLCSGTKLTTIKFAHPEFIRVIGASAFSATPIGEPLFNSWGEAKGYETLIVNDSAYAGCESISKVIMPDNLFLLRKSVFSGCVKLSEVKFGKNTIGADAKCFEGCTALDTVTFNNCLEALGGAAFSNCTALKRVEGLPETLIDWVTENENGTSGWGFANNMFAGDTSLEYVALPKSISVLPEGTFNKCTALTTVVNQGNIVKIGKNAYADCTSLLEAEYPKLVEVEDSAFSGCTSLLAAKYPNLTKIGKSAFLNCSKMGTFEVGHCTAVGDYALQGCTGMESITLMSDEYGKGVFKGCANATKIKVNAAALERVVDELFMECSKLKEVDADLSKSTIIGNSAFAKCTELEKAKFSSVRIIEKSAFADCTSLVSITDGDNPIAAEDYGASCFQNCTSLAVTVDGSISTIGANAFQNSGIKKVDLEGMSGGTVVIGANAFAKCPNLTTARISSAKVDQFSIGSGIFTGAEQLQSAVFDGPIITSSMFKDCTNLKYVDTNATTIKDNAFANCTMLEGIFTIDHGSNMIVKDMGTSAFSGCTSLKNAPSDENTVFSGNQQYANCESLKSVKTAVLTAGMFSGCKGLETVEVSGVTIIPSSCFANCESLKSYDLSNAIEIGEKAFTGSGIESVKCDSAQSIKTSAFQNCADLKSIDVAASTIGASAFANCEFLENAVICTDKVDKGAFTGCASLKSVKFENSGAHTLDTIGDSAFSNCSVLYEVVVPGSPKIGSKALGFNGNKVNADFVLVGDPGSSVEEYATKNKVAFTAVGSFDQAARDKMRHTVGDVDGNSVISVLDAVKMQKWVLGKKTPGIYPDNMDMNADGVVDVFDLALLKKKLRS